MNLTEMPPRIARLPRNKAGYPVPWFVSWIDGEPDFRVADGRKLRAALRSGLCWVCGDPFAGGEERAFCIGPMCAVNRVSAEPASHLECALWSARNCPFLTTPNMTRRDRHLPDGAQDPAGHMITRNPGVALVWVTGYRSWGTREDPDGGMLFDIGDPRRVYWFARGRDATRAEVLDSIDSGLPLLRDLAKDPEAVAELDRMHAVALELIPA